MTLQSPRGSRDILPDQYRYWQHATRAAERVAENLSFRPIVVPTFEDIRVFERAIGEGTDIRDKELFLVRGKHGEEEYALRPEATAGIVRAFAQHGMHTWPQPVRLYSFATCFRYERPQKGRYRELFQFDLETFGEKGPEADAWIILATWKVLADCGLRNVRLKLNSLGLPQERAAYVGALQESLGRVRDRLSEDSRRRLEVNPLRILDSKDPGDQELLAAIPSLHSHFGDQSLTHFETVRRYLDGWGIAYDIDERLVRGLDYYSHTTFEAVIAGSDGSQNSLAGGGRYDGLLPQMDAPDIGAVGAGIGLDRVTEAMEAQGVTLPADSGAGVFMAAVDQPGREAALALTWRLADARLRLDGSLDRPSLGAQLKAAGRSGCRWAVIVSGEDFARDVVQLKDLASGEQREISLDALVSELAR